MASQAGPKATDDTAAEEETATEETFATEERACDDTTADEELACLDELTLETELEASIEEKVGIEIPMTTLDAGKLLDTSWLEACGFDLSERLEIEEFEETLAISDVSVLVSVLIVPSSLNLSDLNSFASGVVRAV